MINSLDKNSCCPEQDQCCENVEAGVIGNDFKLAGSTGNEVLLSDLGHVSADSRITFKRVTHTTRSISTGKKISTVHSSTVSTTRSWSGPSVKAFASNLDGHAVLGFDLLNQIPRSGDLFGWVNNLDALIEEKNVGLKEEQVRTESTCAANTYGDQNIATEEKGLNNKADKEGDKNPAASDGASGSELFTISHSVSFSQMGSTK